MSPNAAAKIADSYDFMSEEIEESSKVIQLEEGTAKKDDKSLELDAEDTRTKGFVVAVAIVAALGGLIFGYDIGGAGKHNDDCIDADV